MPIAVVKNQPRCLFVEDARLRAAPRGKAGEDSGAGWIEGYLAVWGNVDNTSEIMVRGAFARSIQQVVAAGKVPLMTVHFAKGGDARECIGTVTQAKEDDFGLWIHAKLSSDDEAQRYRTRVIEGHIKGLSVGFRAIRWENRAAPDGTQIIAHTECALAEGTLTCRPANELAGITGAKVDGPRASCPPTEEAAKMAALHSDSQAASCAPENAPPQGTAGGPADTASGVDASASASPAPAGTPTPAPAMTGKSETHRPDLLRDLALRKAQFEALTLDA